LCTYLVAVSLVKTLQDLAMSPFFEGGIMDLAYWKE